MRRWTWVVGGLLVLNAVITGHERVDRLRADLDRSTADADQPNTRGAPAALPGPWSSADPLAVCLLLEGEVLRTSQHPDVLELAAATSRRDRLTLLARIVRDQRIRLLYPDGARLDCEQLIDVIEQAQAALPTG